MRKKILITLCVCVALGVFLFILLSEQVTLVSRYRLTEIPPLEAVDLYDHILAISSENSKATPYYLSIGLDEHGKISSYQLCSYT